MSQLFASGGQNIGLSAWTSILPMNTQDWSSVLSFLYSPTLTPIHNYWKNYSFARWTFIDKAMSLLFNMLFRLVMAFLPRSKHLLISWLHSLLAVVLESKKLKSATVSTFSFSPSIELMGLDTMILVFWMLSFKPTFFALFFYPHQEAL